MLIRIFALFCELHQVVSSLLSYISLSSHTVICMWKQYFVWEVYPCYSICSISSTKRLLYCQRRHNSTGPISENTKLRNRNIRLKNLGHSALVEVQAQGPKSHKILTQSHFRNKNLHSMAKYTLTKLHFVALPYWAKY